MPRPLLEVADVIRSAGDSFLDRNREWFSWRHLKVFRAIQACRTAALGGHVDECSRCGHRAISFNSCRNRHCPKCQAHSRDRWLAARRRDLLPTRYVHVVFTLPHPLAPLALQNKREIYDLLFRASAATLRAVARDPRHLGAETGFFSVLHTWNQQLLLHPHVHCVVPAGGLSLDHTRWIGAPPGFFLPVKILSRVFRGKFIAGLRELHRDGRLVLSGALSALRAPEAFAAWLRPLFRSDWVVYSKHGYVTFRWRDSAHKNKQRLARLPVAEFLRRFFLHVLPPGFVRIRYFGFLAHRRRATLLPRCLELLAVSSRPMAAEPPPGAGDGAPPLWKCPLCQGPMILLERLSPVEARLRSPPQAILPC